MIDLYSLSEASERAEDSKPQMSNWIRALLDREEDKSPEKRTRALINGRVVPLV